MLKKSAGFAAAIIPLAMTVSTHAAGFRLPDTSVTALGMANAFSAQADNASANSYNPAAMAWLDGTQTMLGANFIYPSMKHENTDGKTDRSASVWHIQPHAFATHNFGKFSLGMGASAPFGLSSQWAQNSETSKAATYSSMKVANYNLNAAYKLSDKLAVAAGFDFATIDASLYNMASTSPSMIEQRLDGTGNGVGFNAGVMYRPTDDLSLGLSYRSRIILSITGNVVLHNVTTQTTMRNVPADTRLTLPDILLLGASWKATDRLRVNFDLDYTGWSSYDQLIIHNSLSAGGASVKYKEWNNVVAARLGAEYKLNTAWTMRGGLVYDPNPIPDEHFDPIVPDSDRLGVAAGTTFRKGNWSVDAGYMFLHFLSRNVNNSMGGSNTTVDSTLNGTWKAVAHLIGVSTSYAF